MQIEQKEMDAWAQRAFAVNGALLQAQGALRRGDTETVGELLSQAQAQNWRTEKALVRAGAEDPVEVRVAAIRRELGEEPETLPGVQELSLLTSSANRRLLEALQVAREAAAAVDSERGRDEDDGLAQILADYVAATELEVCGPKGLRGLE